MNQDLTINSIVYKKSFDDKSGSLRCSTQRGINLPDTLSIKSQPYVDSVTKVAGNRFTVRFDSTLQSVTGEKSVASAYVVVMVPATASQESITTLLTTLKLALAADNPLLSDVLNFER